MQWQNKNNDNEQKPSKTATHQFNNEFSSEHNQLKQWQLKPWINLNNLAMKAFFIALLYSSKCMQL